LDIKAVKVLISLVIVNNPDWAEEDVLYTKHGLEVINSIWLETVSMWPKQKRWVWLKDTINFQSEQGHGLIKICFGTAQRLSRPGAFKIYGVCWLLETTGLERRC
jgi:hypothetical protein